MIKALTKFSYLYDYIQFMSIELAKYLVVSGSFSRVHEISIAATLTISRNDLAAVFVIKRRSNNFQSAFAGAIAKSLKFAKRCVNDCIQGFLRGYDAAPKAGILFAEAFDFRELHLDLLTIFDSDVPERARI